MNKRTLIIIQFALFLVTMAGSFYVALTPANSLMQWYSIDDAYYYYKVAQNIWNGYGPTFDQINLTNGYHPLWMVVCLAVFWLSKFNLLLPLRVLVIVSGLFNAFTALLFFRFLARHIHPGAALVGAAILGLSPTIYSTVVVHGMESSISVFFIVLLVSNAAKLLKMSDEKKTSSREFLILGLVGAFTILARLDNVFLVATVGLFLLFKIKKIPALLVVDILATALAVLLSWVIRLGTQSVVINTGTVYTMLLLSGLLKPIFLFFSGSYGSKQSLKKIKIALQVTIALAVEAVVEYTALFIMFRTGMIGVFSISIIFLNVMLGLGLILLIRFLAFRPMVTLTDSPINLFLGWVKQQWKPVLLNGVMYAIPIATLIGGYMIFNKLTVGLYTPVSGQIKHWWSSMANTVYSKPVTFLSVIGLSSEDGNGPWSLLTSKVFWAAEKIYALLNLATPEIYYGLLILILIGLLVWVLRTNGCQPVQNANQLFIPAVWLGCFFHIAYYMATGYTHTRIWYWIAEMLLLVVLVSLLLDALFNWMDKIKLKVKPSIFLAGIILAFTLIGHTQYVLDLVPYQVVEGKEDAYLSGIKEVEFYTEPGSKIGMTGGGMVAYFIQDRTIVNLDGLINSPEYFTALKTGTVTSFLDRIPLDYVYGRPYMLLESDPYASFFDGNLVEIGVIRGYENFTLYRYIVNQ